MKYNHAAREERRIRYTAGIWTFLTITAAMIFGFFAWLSGVVLGIGADSDPIAAHEPSCRTRRRRDRSSPTNAPATPLADT